MQSNQTAGFPDDDGGRLHQSTPLSKTVTSDHVKRHTWKSLCLVLIGALEVGARVGIVLHVLKQVIHGEDSVITLVVPLVYLKAWIHATLRPLTSRPATVPYDVLAIYFISFLSIFDLLHVSGPTFGNLISHDPFPYEICLHLSNVVVTLAGIGIMLSMPLNEDAEPKAVDGLQPPKEDYVRLYELLTFSWMSPFITIGTVRPLQESDIWQLSPLLRARIVMEKFRHFKRRSLLVRLLSANALDLLLHWLGAVSSIYL